MTQRTALTMLLSLAAACADYDGVASPTHGLPDEVVMAPQFSRDVLPIIERRCAIGGCHSERTHQAGLYLTRDSAWTSLVDRPSRLFVGEVFVRPGDALDSWMVIAISDDATRRHGLARMPLGSGPLTPDQIQTIRNWINRGAAND
jgi:hypothetical protein